MLIDAPKSSRTTAESISKQQQERLPPAVASSAHGLSSRCTRQHKPFRRRRLLHWNILDGGAERLHGIARFVRDGGFDVVTMNELNGFTEASLARLGVQTGLVHTQLLSKSRYQLGVLSRSPLTPLAVERGHEFAHGVLCVRVLGLSLCVTHLNPHDVHRRALEARLIVKRHARPAIERGRPFMLVGDMNTLSSLDQPEHQAAALPSKIRKGPYHKQLGKKFLSRGSLSVDYTPMQVLLDAPLTDVGAKSGHSVPTSINADKMHFATLRLDYCLVSSDLLAISDGSAEGGAVGRRADKGRAKGQRRRGRKQQPADAVGAGLEEDCDGHAGVSAVGAIGGETIHSPDPLGQQRQHQQRDGTHRARVSASAHLVRDATTNALSDHFPLVCEWDSDNEEVT